MNDIIFEQDKKLQRPYTAKDLLNLAKDPHLAYPQPKVNPGSWFGNLLRRQRMTRAQIIEKVAKDLWLTLEKRDGVFVFRFPDVWRPKDVQDMQRMVLEGIAMLESQCSLIVWLKENPIAMLILAAAFFFGSLCYLTSKSALGLIFLGMTAVWITFFFTACFCWLGEPRVVLPYFGPSDEEKDLVPPYGLGGYIAEPDLDNAFPLGKSHIVNPNAWGFSTKKAAEGLALIGSALASNDRPMKSDDSYEMPQAVYPEMACEMKEGIAAWI